MIDLDLQKQIILNIRTLFKTTMEALDLAQNHTEKVIDFFCSQGKGLQNEYVSVLREWLNRAKSMRDDFRSITESYLSSIERVLYYGETGSKVEEKIETSRKEAAGAKPAPKKGGARKKA